MHFGGPPPVGQGGGPQVEGCGKSLDYLYGCVSVSLFRCVRVYAHVDYIPPYSACLTCICHTRDVCMCMYVQ